MKEPPKTLETFSIRRTNVAEGDKVRYRVYTNAVEYVAVIADSALMAVRVSGVKNPYKILRDIPTSGISVGAERMAPREEKQEYVAFPLEAEEEPISQRIVELSDKAPSEDQSFVAVKVTDLQYNGARASILSPDLMHTIIEDYAKKQEETQTVEAPTVPELVAAAPPETQVTPEETITQLASEVLPSAAEVASAQPKPEEEAVLSPEEVQKLLNE
jgi:hypothetical protein